MRCFMVMPAPTYCFFAFAGLVGGHAAIGADEAGLAVRREVVDEVLHSAEVGVVVPRYAHDLRRAFG